MSTDLKSVAFNDFTGGLVTNRPQTDLKLNESPDLDNIELLGTGFKKRMGDSEYNSTVMNSGADIQGLTYFKPTSGTEYLVAVCGNKIYDSNGFDGTMDDRTDGTYPPTAGKNNIWTFSFIDDFCIAVGGAPDEPLKLTGGSASTRLDANAPLGSFGFAMKNRMFIGGANATPSQVNWSVLLDPEDWTGDGSGNNAAMTNDGDVLTAGIPLNNDTALLFKNRSIHIMNVRNSPFPIKPLNMTNGCVGKLALVNVNGVVYFITPEGRMKATDGYTIQDFPDTIDDIWDGLNASRLKYIQGLYDPVRHVIHWICSNETSTTNNLDIMWDLTRKCWLRNTTGFDANVLCLASDGRIFGGHYNGKIYEKYKSTIFNDASESRTLIDSYWQTAWLSFGDIFAKKQVKYADLLTKIQSTGVVKYSYGFNFNANSKTGSVIQISVGGTWGLANGDTWGDDTTTGTMTWGGESISQKRIYLYGLGNHFEFKIYNNVAGEQMEVDDISMAIKTSGRGVLT